MHKILHKLIRLNRDGLNVVADVNVVVATDGQATARSRSRIVQRNGRSVTVTDTEGSDEPEQEKEV